MRPRTDPRAGFMLVEVLAALLVTAALVAVVLPFAGQLIARWQTGQAAVVEADAWMQGLARLSDDVAEAMPVHEPGRPAVLALSVEPKRVAFIRPALGHGGAGELERVSYRVETMTGGERLVRTAAPMAGGSGGSSVAVLDGPYDFGFAAVGRDGSHGIWRDINAMPLRIDLNVSGRDGHRAPFGPVALPIGARAAIATVLPRLREIAP